MAGTFHGSCSLLLCPPEAERHFYPLRRGSPYLDVVFREHRTESSRTTLTPGRNFHHAAQTPISLATPNHQVRNFPTTDAVQKKQSVKLLLCIFPGLPVVKRKIRPEYGASGSRESIDWMSEGFRYPETKFVCDSVPKV